MNTTKHVSEQVEILSNNTDFTKAKVGLLLISILEDVATDINMTPSEYLLYYDDLIEDIPHEAED